MTDRDISESILFLSYARSNRDFALQLVDDLTRHGFAVWVDKSGLEPGTPDWDEAIRQAIRRSKALILIASPESRRSPFVSGEIEIAHMYGKPVLPMWSSGEDIRDCLPLRLIHT